MKHARLALVILGWSALTGCAPPAAAPMAPHVSASVRIAPATSYGLAVVPHRWTVTDVFQYEATLSMQKADLSFETVASVLPVVLLQKEIAGPQTEATFADLLHGKVYKVDIVAKGNVGGSAAETVLNAENPTVVTLDLTALTAADTTVSKTATVTLDPEEGDPLLELGITPPAADGVAEAPEAIVDDATSFAHTWEVK
jgi:hypothetical protein